MSAVDKRDHGGYPAWRGLGMNDVLREQASDTHHERSSIGTNGEQRYWAAQALHADEGAGIALAIAAHGDRQVVATVLAFLTHLP